MPSSHGQNQRRAIFDQGVRAFQSVPGLSPAPVKGKSSEADMEPEREGAEAPRTPPAQENGDA